MANDLTRKSCNCNVITTTSYIASQMFADVVHISVCVCYAEITLGIISCKRNRKYNSTYNNKGNNAELLSNLSSLKELHI